MESVNNKETKDKNNISIKIYVLTLLIAFICHIPLYYNTYKNNRIEVELTKNSVVIDTLIRKEVKFKKGGNFLRALAFKESSNRYDIVSPSGNYFGAYQMGRVAFKELNFNIDKYGIDRFLSNGRLQDSLCIELLKVNKKYLSSYIKKYKGKIINDIKITESGLLAGGNMGIGYVMTFLRSNGDTVLSDGNNTPITNYIKDLSGYDMSFLSMNVLNGKRKTKKHKTMLLVNK